MPPLYFPYECQGFSREEHRSTSVWIRHKAKLKIRLEKKSSPILIKGYCKIAKNTTSAGVIGLKGTLHHGAITQIICPEGKDFTLSISTSSRPPGRILSIDLSIIGIQRVNLLAWLSRITTPMPLFSRWRAKWQVYRTKEINRRLQITQILLGDEIIFNFQQNPPLQSAWFKKYAIPGINVIGWFRAALGLAQSARCMVKACDSVDLKTALIDLKLNCLNERQDQTYASRLQANNPYPINIFHIDSPESHAIDHAHGADFRRDKYNIAYWAWELSEFPQDRISQCRFFDEIWCPSQFVREALVPGVPLPVQVMPHAIDFPIPQGNPRRRFGLPENRFLFLFIYDLNSYSERKNPLAVIEAYKQAFPDEAGVGLVIKTHTPHLHQDNYQTLRNHISDLKQVKLMCETYSQEQIHALQAACDVFVSLHRAEGFGLGPAESMFLGKPVISTNWSSTSEFIDKSNGCPVNYRLITLDKNYGPYDAGQIWADPDIDHAAFWMRKLVEDTSLYTALSAAAKLTILDKFSPRVIGLKYRQRLEAMRLWI